MPRRRELTLVEKAPDLESIDLESVSDLRKALLWVAEVAVEGWGAYDAVMYSDYSAEPDEEERLLYSHLDKLTSLISTL